MSNTRAFYTTLMPIIILLLVDSKNTFCSVELYNFASSGGIDYGNIGVMYNVKDGANFDFAIFRYDNNIIMFLVHIVRVCYGSIYGA